MSSTGVAIMVIAHLAFFGLAIAACFGIVLWVAHKILCWLFPLSEE